MKKIILTSIFFIGLTISGFAQSEKLSKKVEAIIVKLNNQITSVDASLALTDNQKKQLTFIHINRLQELRKAKKEGANKNVNKDINKKYFQRIYKNVISKEQRDALKKAKQKSKA